MVILAVNNPHILINASPSPTTTTPSSAAKTHAVQVGPPEDPYHYVPANITADVGDVIVFSFYPRNHSVVQADYLAPCVPKRLGSYFYSGMFDDFHEEGGRFTGTVGLLFFPHPHISCSLRREEHAD